MEKVESVGLLDFLAVVGHARIARFCLTALLGLTIGYIRSGREPTMGRA